MCIHNCDKSQQVLHQVKLRTAYQNTNLQIIEALVMSPAFHTCKQNISHNNYVLKSWQENVSRMLWVESGDMTTNSPGPPSSVSR